MHLDHSGSVEHMINDHNANPDRLAEMLRYSPQHDEFWHECLHYGEAVDLVTVDVRKSYPNLSYREAIDLVRSMLDQGVVEGDGELAAAYRIVIEGR